MCGLRRAAACDVRRGLWFVAFGVWCVDCEKSELSAYAESMLAEIKAAPSTDSAPASES